MNNGYAICFNEWVFDTSIKNELPLLLYISSLTAEKGYCYASNKHLADMFKTSEETISRKIKKLTNKKYITIDYKKRGSAIISRFIRLTKISTDRYQKNQRTVDENVKDNNTSINNNITPFIFSPLEKNHNFTCECNCKRKAKVEINGIKYCGQHGRMKLEELGKFEFSIEMDEKENLPEALNQEAFKMWCKYKGKSYSKQGKTLSINKLIKHPKEIQMQMVEQSIMNNYKGLFEIKQQKQARASGTEMSDFLIGRGVPQEQLQSQELIEGEIYE